MIHNMMYIQLLYVVRDIADTVVMRVGIVLIFSLLSTSIYAKQQDAESLTTSKIVDQSHEVVTAQLHQWIDGVDQFFGEERAIDRQNSSQFLFRFQTVRYSDRLFWEPKIRARLDLPRTKSRLRLLLSSDSRGEGEEDLDSPVNALQEGILETVDPASFSAALQFVVTTSELFDVNTKAGVAYNKGPDPFVSARASAQTKFVKWNIRATQQAYFFARQRFGEELLVDIERQVFDRVLLRLNSNLNWWDEVGEFQAIQSASIIVPITNDFALSFVGISQQLPENDWRTESNYLYTVVRYRFYKDWAYMQIKPQLEYLRENNFNAQLSITAGLELIFGKKRSAEMVKKMEELDRPDRIR